MEPNRKRVKRIRSAPHKSDVGSLLEAPAPRDDNEERGRAKMVETKELTPQRGFEPRQMNVLVKAGGKPAANRQFKTWNRNQTQRALYRCSPGRRSVPSGR